MYLSRAIPGGSDATVLLDGQLLNHCFAADDTEGWAVCAVLGADGRPISPFYLAEDDPRRTNIDPRSSVLVETRSGQVTFQFSHIDSRTMAEAWHRHYAIGPHPFSEAAVTQALHAARAALDGNEAQRVVRAAVAMASGTGEPETAIMPIVTWFISLSTASPIMGLAPVNVRKIVLERLEVVFCGDA